ncbi:CBASS cGAMP-activated phospholipase [Vibrio diazotrophicus]|uniref:CBASS cGAMP-activated phospholipase n=1 Tax=Vibrio diazotrophicus TaxID=685 RepID=UPI000C9DE97C|nr:CBASS cGAMP-activated phospholipase [Vibrio diazotrophicus]PNH94718.1 patatin [Vibrio diazotrophicus]USN27081.1 patatin [synthetic construct]
MRDNLLPSNAIRILSLNGGGVRGLFTISVLAELERILEESSSDKRIKIGDYFDLITGTSIGGLLALGLAEGKSARELKDVFYSKGDKIFPQYKWFNNGLKTIKKAFGATYKTEPLKEAIVEMIGEKTTFNDLNRRVMIPTVNLSTGRPQFFKTPHNPDFTRDGPLKLVDAALATSAAPTYFEPYFCEDLKAYFADGGLVANNPSFVGLHEVFGDMKADFPDASYSDIYVLNVGTMGEEYALSPKLLRKKKGYFGMWGLGERLVLTTMTANQILHQFMLSRELSVHGTIDNYISLDSRVPNEAAGDITLDNSSIEALDNLASRGKQLANEEFAKDKRLALIFSRPAKPFKS